MSLKNISTNTLKARHINIMAIIKSYTDLEQSKKLSEILPLESADMYYAGHQSIINPKEWEYGDRPKTRGKYISFDDKRIFYPCWSLAALLDIMPNSENISTNLSKGGYRISTLEYTNSWFVDYEDETNGLNNCVTSSDNPVDACYEMILKLHEQNIL